MTYGAGELNELCKRTSPRWRSEVMTWGLPVCPPSSARPWRIRSGGRNMHKRVGIILILAALLLAGAGPAHAWYGYHGFGRSRVVIVPRVVIPGVPFWAPYPYPAVVLAPPVYVQPPPQVSVQPPPQPQAYWYYMGTSAGAQSGAISAGTIQRGYDVAYVQCLSAQGNQVPGMVSAAPPSYAPPPPPNAPPPPGSAPVPPPQQLPLR
jgi:hypothetical protein